MKLSTLINKKRPAVQVGLILLASAAVGLAYNALNPAGVQWSDPAAPGLFRNATLSAQFVSLGDAVAEPAEPATVVATEGTRRAVSTAARTTWEAVQPLVDRGEIVLVDSRSTTSFDAGHIPGAVSLPFKEMREKIATFAAAHPPETALVVYCSSAKCAESGKLAGQLTQNYGYRDVRYVPGGYLEWRSKQATNTP